MMGSTYACCREPALGIPHLAAERAFELTNAVRHLSGNVIAGSVIVLGPGDTAPFEHELPETPLQVRLSRVMARYNRNAGTITLRLFDNLPLFEGCPALSTAAIAEDFDIRQNRTHREDYKGV
ncbi:hypothetical protein [Paracoccus aestuarii]|uniref:hypothetical protein n=1 Tax=Paracoccus aestuarii TaxID=453842 RepID=UPI0011C42A6E|nr:hypothetical protein JHW48_08995 [Paracoccus aestuarii]